LDFLKELGDDRIELLTSETNIGCEGGRKMLTQQVETPFTMMLDDDMYLTNGSIMVAMDLFRKEPAIGAISMPQYDMNGSLVSLGGRKLPIRNGVIRPTNPVFDSSAYWLEVQHVDGGAMVFRTEMRDCFTWDDRSGAFEDWDKSLQMMRSGKWKLAIVPNGKLIHDRSWVGKYPSYERVRFDGLALHRDYKYFRKKWGLRLDLRGHILFDLIYPAVALTRFPVTVSQINSYTRTARRRLPF
jgi:GT2 family glycosyltransferase